MKIYSPHLFKLMSPDGSSYILCELLHAEWDCILYRTLHNPRTKVIKDKALPDVRPVSNKDKLNSLFNSYKVLVLE